MKERYFIGCDEGLFEGDVMAISVTELREDRSIRVVEMERFTDLKEFEKEKERLKEKYNIKD
jgi:hypothetical protein